MDNDRAPDDNDRRTALVTGGSRGLGRALATRLAGDGWRVVVDGRDAARLTAAVTTMPGDVTAVPGDVSDPAHRERIVQAVGTNGLDLLVNNASVLGPSPQPRLADYPLEALAEVYAVNVVAPLALLQLLLTPLQRRRGTVVDVSSDAAVEPYQGWGGYGSAKAALDQVTAVLAAEHPELSVYAFDPGDMRTELQQQAFPGEDIADRPEPDSVVPALLRLLGRDLPSGRYRAADLVAVTT